MKALCKSPWFWFGLMLKLACLALPGSTYIREYFIPFLDKAITAPLENPWNLSPPQHFPYGSVLYLLLAVPRFVVGSIFGIEVLGTSSIGLALVRFPLLCLDLALLYLLCCSATGYRQSRILWLYWLNPVLFYITFVHGQLDVAAMTFAIASLIYMTQNRLKTSALALAAATLCKFHVVLLVPLMTVYLWNRHFRSEALKKISLWLGLFVLLTIVGFIPAIQASRFDYVTTQSPEAFRVFSLNLAYSNNQVLYLGVALVAVVLGRLCLSTRLSAKGLLVGAGLLMGSLLLITNPMAGWYFWIFPFVALFYAWYANVPLLLYIFSVVCYFIYFVGLSMVPLPPLFQGLSLTALQTSLFGILVAFYVYCLQRETPTLGRVRPVAIGISGDSGSGKNYISTLLMDLFNKEGTRIIEGDNYHRWKRGDENWAHFTHLNPQANNLLDWAQNAKSLTQGLPVWQRHYNHESGDFSEPRFTAPSKTVIFQGLHALYLTGLRRKLSLKVFVSPHELLRLAWKLERDTAERGASAEKVLASIRARAEDAEKHITPQKKYADWIVEYVPEKSISLEEVMAGKKFSYAVKHTVWNDVPLVRLIESIGRFTKLNVKLDFDPQSIDRVSLSVSGEASAPEVEQVALATFSNLRHLTRGRKAPLWHEGLNGVTQLVALAILEHRQELNS